jgi:hypothetical protein
MVEFIQILGKKVFYCWIYFSSNKVIMCQKKRKNNSINCIDQNKISTDWSSINIILKKICISSSVCRCVYMILEQKKETSSSSLVCSFSWTNDTICLKFATKKRICHSIYPSLFFFSYQRQTIFSNYVSLTDIFSSVKI